MAFEGRYRDTQRGGGFGSGATSVQPSENGAAAVSCSSRNVLLGRPLATKRRRESIQNPHWQIFGLPYNFDILEEGGGCVYTERKQFKCAQYTER